MKHESIEKHLGLLTLFIIVAISLGGLAQITPLLFQQQTNEPVTTLRPYSALELEGRDIYIREGCSVCHSQMIRPFRAETERYGHYSLAGEHVWEHPFLWGSKRTGPDLARVGGRYSDAWHEVHLINPRDVVPQSNMPAFPWLSENHLDGIDTRRKLEIFNMLSKHRGHKDAQDQYLPLYSKQQIVDAGTQVQGKTEMQALIAYLQSLGHALQR